MLPQQLDLVIAISDVMDLECDTVVRLSKVRSGVPLKHVAAQLWESHVDLQDAIKIEILPSEKAPIHLRQQFGLGWHLHVPLMACGLNRFSEWEGSAIIYSKASYPKIEQTFYFTNAISLGQKVRQNCSPSIRVFIKNRSPLPIPPTTANNGQLQQNGNHAVIVQPVPTKQRLRGVLAYQRLLYLNTQPCVLEAKIFSGEEMEEELKSKGKSTYLLANEDDTTLIKERQAIKKEKKKAKRAAAGIGIPQGIQPQNQVTPPQNQVTPNVRSNVSPPAGTAPSIPLATAPSITSSTSNNERGSNNVTLSKNVTLSNVSDATTSTTSVSTSVAPSSSTIWAVKQAVTNETVSVPTNFRFSKSSSVNATNLPHLRMRNSSGMSDMMSTTNQTRQTTVVPIVGTTIVGPTTVGRTGHHMKKIVGQSGFTSHATANTNGISPKDCSNSESSGKLSYPGISPPGSTTSSELSNGISPNDTNNNTITNPVGMLNNFIFGNNGVTPILDNNSNISSIGVVQAPTNTGINTGINTRTTPKSVEVISLVTPKAVPGQPPPAFQASFGFNNRHGESLPIHAEGVHSSSSSSAKVVNSSLAAFNLPTDKVNMLNGKDRTDEITNTKGQRILAIDDENVDELDEPNGFY